MKLDIWLTQQIAEIEKAGLLRKLHIQTQPADPGTIQVGEDLLFDFASNDYLGLRRHPVLIKSAIEALQKWGTSSGASRLMSGTTLLHAQAEETLAKLVGAEAAILFSSGYTAALGTIQAVANENATIILDRLSHASLIDGARLSKASLKVYRHNDLEHLEYLLRKIRSTNTGPILIITESIFSMDGDIAPIQEIVELKDKYESWLLLDEAHAVGVMGKNGGGLAESYNLTQRIEFRIVTLGKALGCSGACVCGSKKLIQYLQNKARSWIYSTAVPPHIAASIVAAINIITSEEGIKRREKLYKNIELFNKTIPRPYITPIIPIILGNNELAIKASVQLREYGFYIPAIRFPTVPKRTERLRISISAAHSETVIESLLQTLIQLGYVKTFK